MRPAGAQVFVVDVEEDTALFSNPAIQRAQQVHALARTCVDVPWRATR